MDILEGQDIYADDFIRQEQLLQELQSPSEIERFFEDANVFVTGGTGFLGKILIEKLLRVCWKLKRIYLLIRPKKGKTVDQRFQELFEGPLFDTLKRQQPNFQTKVTLITGDLAQDGAIISEEDKKILIQNVDVVFHCAATVRFDETLRHATVINVKATKYFLDMAREMKNLKAFIYVSTAYSNCPFTEIKEEFYTPPFDYQRLIGLLNVLDDALLNRITPEVLGKWPNTYAFTKTIAEYTVKQYGKGLPVGILRPSIVISTFKEPITGWINNYYGPQGVVFGTALGLLRTLHCDPNVLADMVPVDLVINALIAFAWDVAQTKGDNPNFESVSWNENDSSLDKNGSSDEIPVLNYVSSERNRITWGEFMEYNYKAGQNCYSPLILWHSSLTLNPNKYVDLSYQYFCHYLPALIVDFIAKLLGKKPGLYNAYKKIHKFSAVLSYFCTHQWKFKEDNVLQLWSKLSRKDKKLFNFNITDVNWEHYFFCYIRGIRVYMAKDEMSTVSVGQKRYLKLKILHYTLVTILNLFLLYALWWIFSLIIG